MHSPQKFLTLSIIPKKNKHISLNIINRPNVPDTNNVQSKIKGRKSKWNLEYLLDQGNVTHGSRYDYSLITPDQVKSVNSYISIRCRHHDVVSALSVNLCGK